MTLPDEFTLAQTLFCSLRCCVRLMQICLTGPVIYMLQ